MIPMILSRVQFSLLLLRQWLAKQAEARKVVQAAKQADPASIERDPLWYKDRGKYVLMKNRCLTWLMLTCAAMHSEFFKAGNYPAASNAFTAGSMLC